MDSGQGLTFIAEQRVEGVRGQIWTTQSGLTQAFVGQARVTRSLVQDCFIGTQSCLLYVTIDTLCGL